MDTAAYRGRWFKERARVRGERPGGAASNPSTRHAKPPPPPQCATALPNVSLLSTTKSRGGRWHGDDGPAATQCRYAQQTLGFMEPRKCLTGHAGWASRVIPGATE